MARRPCLIEATPNLVWLLLTKRIGNVRKMTYRNVAICSSRETWPLARRSPIRKNMTGTG